MKNKSDTFRNYKKYEAWVKLQRGANIHIFGCDRGGKFMLKAFTEHLQNTGTVRHLTVHDSPASNGAAERANRTHMDGARAMMDAAGLPKNLWAEVVRHHVWIRNRVPTRALPEMKTPHEIGTGEKPDLSAVRPWGCKAWVKRVGVGKLEPRAEECRFVGIDDEAKGYRIYWPGKNRVSVERNVYFNESEALEPEEAPVEGENDGLTNSNHPFNSNTSRNNPESLQPVDNAPNMSNETHKPENIENTPEIRPEMNQTLPETPIPLAPHQRPK
jgi:hypothetical protein